MDLDSRYELLEKLGTGSFATVYRARDNELGREVAIKQIHQQYVEDADQLDRYWQEAQLLASLQHPNITTIYDLYRDRGWLILELMQANLKDRMEGRQMDLRALRATVAHGLRALKYLHSRGIIHGDIKTSNLMIDHRRRVKVGDFGLARRVSDDDGSLLKGTTKYMAPEVMEERFGEVGPASDLYSLGFAAYELMCGPNFEDLFPGLSAFGRNPQIAWMMWHAAPDRRLPEIGRVLQGVPEDLAHVIQKLCEKDQAKRYATAQEALDDLGTESTAVASTKQNTDVDLETDPEAKAAAEQKKRNLIAGGAFAVSLILSMLVLFWPSGSDPQVDNDAPENIGFIRSVDADSGEIVWTDIEEGIPSELQIAGTPKIRLTNEDRYVLLKELQPGDRIRWQPVEGDGPIRELVASRPITNTGRLIATDLRKNTILVSVEDTAAQEQLTLSVPTRAKLFLNDQKATLEQLQAEDVISVTHLPPINDRGLRILEELRANRSKEMVGYLYGIDPETKTLQVRLGTGLESQVKRMPYADDLEVLLETRGEAVPAPSGVDDLKPGDRVRMTFAGGVQSITLTRSEKKAIDAMITELDVPGRTVTVQNSTGDITEFTLPDDSEITLSQRDAELVDLRITDRVDVQYVSSQDARTSPDAPPGEVRHSVETLDAHRSIRNDRFVVLVGTEAYRGEGISALPYARESADRLAEVMLTRYAVNPNRLTLLLDSRRLELQKKLQLAIEAVGEDFQLVVYLCCHAYQTNAGETFLAATDTKLDDLSETGISLGWLLDTMERSPSKNKLLLLDISHTTTDDADAERQPPVAQMIANLPDPPRTVDVITNAGPNQKGHPDPEGLTSLFALALADGFSGTADQNRDLLMTADELFGYVTFALSNRPTASGMVLQPVRK